MNAGNFNETVLYNKVLTLKYTNGEKCEKCNCKREVLITFVCAPEEGDGRPILMSSLEECTTVFIWRTKYVCETQVTYPTKSDQTFLVGFSFEIESGSARGS